VPPFPFPVTWQLSACCATISVSGGQDGVEHVGSISVSGGQDVVEHVGSISVSGGQDGVEHEKAKLQEEGSHFSTRGQNLI
jgi:hypothetical protein